MTPCKQMHAYSSCASLGMIMSESRMHIITSKRFCIHTLALIHISNMNNKSARGGAHTTHLFEGSDTFSHLKYFGLEAPDPYGIYGIPPLEVLEQWIQWGTGTNLRAVVEPVQNTSIALLELHAQEAPNVNYELSDLFAMRLDTCAMLDLLAS